MPRRLVYSIPMRTRFRQLDVREGVLIEGDAGWGEFRRQLDYKSARAGRTLVVVDRGYPSSKTCSTCGHVLAELTLSVRHWTCPDCRTRHDRDLNAAKNILAAGLAATARGGRPEVRAPSETRTIRQEAA